MENQILAKGNNSWKSRSSVTKVELDLYFVMTNSYTKSQKTAEKSPENWSGRDGRTDSEQTKSPPASR